MHLDKYGLPVQADGDANDQLQRCGMIDAAFMIRGSTVPLGASIVWTCGAAIVALLQSRPGVYVRFIGGPTDTVSADQLIAALAAHVASGSKSQVWLMFKAMMKRFGFAQNTKDGLNGSIQTKTPDFMFFRALPLFCRRPLLYPIALFTDALLVLLALSAVGPVWKDSGGFKRRSPDDVDDNNTILTLAVCRIRCPTPLSYLAIKLYSWLRPWNKGCIYTGTKYIDLPVDAPVEYRNNYYHPVYGALRWYHRAEAGGNPEIAEMWKPIIERYFI